MPQVNPFASLVPDPSATQRRILAAAQTAGKGGGSANAGAGLAALGISLFQRLAPNSERNKAKNAKEAFSEAFEFASEQAASEGATTTMSEAAGLRAAADTLHELGFTEQALATGRQALILEDKNVAREDALRKVAFDQGEVLAQREFDAARIAQGDRKLDQDDERLDIAVGDRSSRERIAKLRAETDKLIASRRDAVSAGVARAKLGAAADKAAKEAGRDEAKQREAQENHLGGLYRKQVELPREAINQLDAAFAALDADTGFGDTASVMIALKIMDPASVSREAEVEAVRKSTDIPESVKGTFLAWIDGQSLSPDAEIDLRRTLLEIAKPRFAEIERAHKDFSVVADRKKLTMGNIAIRDDTGSRQRLEDNFAAAVKRRDEAKAKEKAGGLATEAAAAAKAQRPRSLVPSDKDGINAIIDGL